MSEVALHKEFIAVNGVKLHVVSAGPADGEPILMLHGFPEFWYGWRHQIDFLAQQGYRVIAPDQRGYNLSDKPRSASDYRISTLAQDIDALIGALGYEQVNLVGHDWGGAVAWWVATMFPQRLKKLIILNIPYPSVMKRAFQSGNFAQLRKSWYMFAFQVPWLPEALAAVNDYRGVAKSIAGTGKPGTFSEADLDLYRAAWRQPGAMRGMINWYRAMFRQSAGPRREPGQRLRITMPTLLIWGEQDRFLGKELAQPSIDLCDDGRIVFLPEATHWVQHDEAAEVNRLIQAFVSGTL